MKTLSPSLTLILLSILALTSFLPLTSCSDDNSVASDEAYREFVCGTPSSDDRYNLTATHSGSVIQIKPEEYVILVDSLRGFTLKSGPILLSQKSTGDSLVDLKPFLGKEISITGGAVIPPSLGRDSVNISGKTKYVPIYPIYNLKIQSIPSRSSVDNF